MDELLMLTVPLSVNYIGPSAPEPEFITHTISLFTLPFFPELLPCAAIISKSKVDEVE